MTRAHRSIDLRTLLGISIVGLMLAWGLTDDVLDFWHERPRLPDRYLGLDIDLLRAWVEAHAPVLLWAIDALTSVLLAVAGVASALGSRKERGLLPLAFICGLAVLDDTATIGMPAIVSDAYFSLYWFLLFAALVRLGSTFPDRLRPEEVSGYRLDRWLLSGPRLWVSAVAAGLVLWGLNGLRSLDPPTWVFWVAWPVRLGVAIVFPLLLIFRAARYFQVGYRRASPEERRRIVWLFQAAWLYLYGFLFATAVAIAAGLSGSTLLEIGGAVAYLLIVAAAAVFLLLGIFYGGAVDPAWTFQRTAVGTALVTVLPLGGALAYEALAEAIEEWIAGLLPVSSTLVTALGVTALVMAVGVPLRRWIVRITDPLYIALARTLESEAVLLRSDIAAFEELAARDPVTALRSVRALRTAARRAARGRRGVILEKRADGVLVQLRTPEDALDAALDLQRRAAAGELDRPICTTVHRGCVYRGRGGEPFGAGVSVTMRTHGSTPAGSVYATEPLVAALERRDSYELAPVGLLTAPAGEETIRLFEVKDPAPG